MRPSPEEGKKCSVKAALFPFFLFFSQASPVFSERENRRLYLALTFTATR